MSKGRDKKEDREEKEEQLGPGNVKLQYKGEQVYQGHLDGQFRKIWPNAVIEVSKERALKLKQDYPKLFTDTDAALSIGDVQPAAPSAGKVPVANKAAEAEGTK